MFKEQANSEIRLISTYIRPFTWHACPYFEATDG